MLSIPHIHYVVVFIVNEPHAPRKAQRIPHAKNKKKGGFTNETHNQTTENVLGSIEQLVPGKTKRETLI
jgi:hypothetical protein